MAVRKTLRAQYLRRKYREQGIEAFQPKEALELLLGYCSGDHEVYRLIDALYDRFYTIDRILNAEYGELLSIEGMTESTAVMLGSMRGVGEAVLSQGLMPEVLDSPEKACGYFRLRFRGSTVEEFKIACLDDRMAAYRCVSIAEGTTYGVDIDCDRLIAELRKYRCRRCIIAHNHPGGSCRPSNDDVRSTERLRTSLGRQGVQLVDHVIVGADGAVSLYFEGCEGY